jgi:hypothetical protein
MLRLGGFIWFQTDLAWKLFALQQQDEFIKNCPKRWLPPTGKT